MTFKEVDTIFEEYFADLREVTKENAPNTYMYFGETAEDVWLQDDDIPEFNDYDYIIGSGEKIVAHAYDLHNFEWHGISADATPSEVRGFFESNSPTTCCNF